MQFRVRAFFNQSNLFVGYRQGDTLRPSIVPACDIDADNAYDAAEYLYAMLNRDDRPNGAVEQSLSVGDVVAVEGPHGREAMLCSMIGFVSYDMGLDLDEPYTGGSHGPDLPLAELRRLYDERVARLAAIDADMYVEVDAGLAAKYAGEYADDLPF